MSADARKPYDLTTARHDYPARDQPPHRTILVCSHPRSGSTLLGEALYFAGGLGCPLEYFHRGFRPGLAERWGTHNIRQHIDAVQRLRTDPGGTCSVKLFWRDVEDMVAEIDPQRFTILREMAPAAVPVEMYQAIAELLSTAFPNPEFLHLYRRDQVRQAISSLAATQTGLWRLIPGHATSPIQDEAEYDFARISSLVGNAAFCHGHWRNFFAAIGATPYSLSYEELLADYQGSVRALLRHLGNDTSVPAVRMRRQSDERTERLVLRYLKELRGPPSEA